MTERKWPACECRDNSCPVHEGNYAPAAFVVKRDGKEIKVCTHCDLNGSDEYIQIIPAKDDDLSEFRDYDLLGYGCLLDKLEVEVPGEVIFGGLLEGLEAVTSGKSRLWNSN